MKTHFKHLGVAVALSVTAAATQAASYSFTGLGFVAPFGYSTSSGGIGVTVSPANPKYDLVANGSGLGVTSGFFNGPYLGNGDALKVEFSKPVTIGSIKLGKMGLFDKGLLSSSGGDLTLKGSGLDWYQSYDLSSLGEISSFTLESSGVLSGFALAGMCNVDAAAVPVPAAAWLFGSALLGLVGIKRRR